MNLDLVIAGTGLALLALVAMAAYTLARGGGRITAHRRPHGRHRAQDQPGGTLARAVGNPEYLADLPARTPDGDPS